MLDIYGVRPPKIIILPTELSAAAVLINYWNKEVNNAVWITIFMIVVIVINMFGAGVYGECEFIFAYVTFPYRGSISSLAHHLGAFRSIKVITITGLIILGIVLDLGGGPNHDRLGFRYWKKPGPFVQFSGIGGSKGQFLGKSSIVMS